MAKRQSSPEPTVFDLMAGVGLTKHLGGLEATDELIELCGIGEGTYVLDVGCGVGMTPCYLAQRYGCQVIGVDISEMMIDKANERAKREGVEDRVTFRVADARDLPFEDELFDAVTVESVNVFFEEKQRATSEYVRVTKAGGHVGLNETTWIKAPPAEMVEYVSRVQMEALMADGWEELLTSAGLRDVVVRTYQFNVFREGVNRVRRYGLAALLRASYRTLALYIKHPASRTILKAAGALPKGIFGYMGRGIYVGTR